LHFFGALKYEQSETEEFWVRYAIIRNLDSWIINGPNTTILLLDVFIDKAIIFTSRCIRKLILKWAFENVTTGSGMD
jgi:hypothetical protein